MPGFDEIGYAVRQQHLGWSVKDYIGAGKKATKKTEPVHHTPDDMPTRGEQSVMRIRGLQE